MLHDIVQAYADAVHVAITLQPPLVPRRMADNSRFADCEARRRSRPALRLIPHIAAWFSGLILRARRAGMSYASGRRPLHGCG
jgi:hypothetical protein